VPLHTLRADIDYGFAEAKTTFGRIGVKVWINKGEVMPAGFGEGDERFAQRRQSDFEGLGASSREGGRRGPDREGLGPVRQRRRGSGPPGRGSGRARPGAPRQAQPSDEAVSTEAPPEPTAEVAPPPPEASVAGAPEASVAEPAVEAGPAPAETPPGEPDPDGES
jgi:hypothetical protein